jgi:hypothetical protein
MTETDGMLRARALEAYEAIPSLEAHGELTRLILAEVSLLTEKYRHVRRHDVPHIKELSGLLDVLWQEVEMELAEAGVVTDPRTEIETLPLFGSAAATPPRDRDPDGHARPAFRL